MSESLAATVKFFDDVKGFGFVDVPGLGDAFVRWSALPGVGYKTLINGEPVMVELAQNERGWQVTRVRRPPHRRRPPGSSRTDPDSPSTGMIRPSSTTT